jgi:uncharacterized protein YdaU (DUF1376 family)
MTVRGERDPLPYYPWFVKDFRANRKVQRMNYVERGLYRELLDECWEEGSIPDDPLRLAEMCNCPPGVMVEAWPKIRACFTATDALDGMYLVNPKLESIRDEIEAKRDLRSMAGKTSAMLRASKRSTPVDTCSTSVNKRQLTEQNRTKESISVRSTNVELDGPAAASLLQVLAAGPCAWCGEQPPAHLPTCRPQRVAGPING